ncbi:MAG: AAA family ATPase [Lachnospiraceae bacterium]|jgi:MoxR-like ATPase
MNSDRLSLLRENVEKVIIGKSQVIDLVLTSLIAGGHVLLEDVPGTGKTMMAKSLAHSMNAEFSRVQFTPDLLPSDITGLNFFNQKSGEFTFRPGPVFCNILLADEINRATPRTQSALLECMEERQVTIDGETRRLPDPFFVIATENPVETTGTFPLPEAQLDRFFMKLAMGLPSRDEELAILDRFESAQPLDTLEPVCTAEDITRAHREYTSVFVHPALKNYMVDLVQATRNHPYVSSGVSPRGSLALLHAVQAYAYLQGRDYAVPEDITATAVPVLSHRLIANRGVGSLSDGDSVIRDILSKTPVPTENWRTVK